MLGFVYALLVGVNEYMAVNSLNGCVDDVREFERFLSVRTEPDRLRARTLLDGEATRAAVISGFAEHLQQAADGDVAVFYFAGHGSYETVDERFWFLEPSGRNQTIVCADSRHDGIPDLADKELNELIAAVAANGAHVVVILDCCHSGGGTRDGAVLPDDVHVRQVPPAAASRSLDTYLPGVRAALASGAAPPLARHVALSACEANQLAKEIVMGSTHRGVFSAMLWQALVTLGPEATYRDVIAAASVGVRDRVRDQYPVLYAPDPDDLDQQVLGDSVRGQRSGISLEFLHGAWSIDAGLVHGIQPPAPSGTPDNDGTTILAVLPPRRPELDEVTDQPVGVVRVTDVELARSLVRPDGDWQPSTDTRYEAVVIDVPLPLATVELRGQPESLALIRTYLIDCAYVAEATERQPLGTHFIVIGDAGAAEIARVDGTRIAGPFAATAMGAAALARQLDHLARWHLVKGLDNPLSALAGQVAMEIVLADKRDQPRRADWTPVRPGADGEIHLSYRQVADSWEAPYIFVYLRNLSARSLFCTLLDLTDSFRSHTRLFPGDWIPAGGVAVAFEGTPLDVSIPRNRLAASANEVRDWFKLIAAEERFETAGFELLSLGETAEPNRAAARRPSVGSVIARLGSDAATRDAGYEGKDTLEWTTALASLCTRHPGT